MRLTLKQRKSRNGWLYILPWIIGMAVFFIPALWTTVVYSFSEVNVDTRAAAFTGISNYYHAFRGDAEFPQLLAGELQNNLGNTVLILIFSYFVAMLLKKPFKGSFIIKAIFFLTVILSSDVFTQLNIEVAAIGEAVRGGVKENSGSILTKINGDLFVSHLTSLGVGEGLIEFIASAVNRVAEIFNRSGVQIFIFLAGLSTIPQSMYEAAYMEGATGWEAFWKITFPMTTSIMIVNFVYTVVDSFASMLSPMMQYIFSSGMEKNIYGYGSAMIVIYFSIIGICIGAVIFATRKKVFYYA